MIDVNAAVTHAAARTWLLAVSRTGSGRARSLRLRRPVIACGPPDRTRGWLPNERDGR